MQIYEFPAEISEEGTFDVPATLLKTIPSSASVHVVLIVKTPNDMFGDDVWARLAAEQLLLTYCGPDSLGDEV